MRLGIVVSLGVLAFCAARAMGGCADETVVAVYGGSGEGGYGEGGCEEICGPGPAVNCHDCELPESMGGEGPGPQSPDCYEEGAALVLSRAVGGVEIHQNLCTATQITDVFAACIDDTMTQESCDAFVAAAPENQACLDCVIGGGAQPYPMPVTIAGEMFQYLSLYACAAEVAGLPECELPFQSLILCGNTACQSCDQDDDDKQNECLNYALNDPELCGFIEIPATCSPLLRATELPAECIGNATTFAAAFPILADFYCGAP